MAWGRRMGKLIYSAIASVDGCIEDDTGSFSWAAPDEEVHAAANDLERSLSTHLLGRRMYETLVWWETVDTGPQQPRVMREFAEMWRATDKIVYSRTLKDVSSARTRIERVFEPAAVERLKRGAAGDVSVGGPALAAHAFAAGLVDECHLFLVPVAVGGGKRVLPAGVRVRLELAGERRFAGGAVHLHYRVRG